MGMSEKEFCAKLLKDAPVICDFNFGDTVTYTNDYGAKFCDLKIIGFSRRLGMKGEFIHLSSDCYWSPVSPSSLKHNNQG